MMTNYLFISDSLSTMSLDQCMFFVEQKSLEDAGDELNQMRTELHKLVEVIQVKDHTIESLEEQLHSLKDVSRWAVEEGYYKNQS